VSTGEQSLVIGYGVFCLLLGMWCMYGIMNSQVKNLTKQNQELIIIRMKKDR
jgi:hypothetical protein